VGKLKLRQEHSIRQESFSPALPGIELTIDIVSGAITGSERFFSTYGIYNFQSWVQAIFDEDRETVQQVLLHPAIEPPHRLYYRLVAPTGVIHSVEHVILATFEGTIRTEVRLVDKAKATKGFLPTIYLQTIAIQHGLKLNKNSMIQFPQVQRLAPILKEIKECLREEGIDSDIELAPGAFEPVCSLCGANLFIASTFTLTFAGLSLDRTDLDALVNEEHSLSRVGAQSPWKAMLSHLHSVGLHVVIGVNFNRSLVFTIGTDPGD
jgi:hypothetical protein